MVYALGDYCIDKYTCLEVIFLLIWREMAYAAVKGVVLRVERCLMNTTLKVRHKKVLTF